MKGFLLLFLTLTVFASGYILGVRSTCLPEYSSGGYDSGFSDFYGHGHSGGGGGGSDEDAAKVEGTVVGPDKIGVVNMS